MDDGFPKTISICEPQPAKTAWRIVRCSACKRLRRVCVRFFEWYDPIFICWTCGEETILSQQKLNRFWIKEEHRAARKVVQANAIP